MDERITLVCDWICSWGRRSNGDRGDNWWRRMTAKEYLQQVYVVTKRLQRLNMLREKLLADAYSIGSPAGSLSFNKVQTSKTGDKIERAIARIDKTDRRICSEIKRLHDSSTKIQRQIEALDDERYKSVLFGRYIMCQTWEKIAEDVPCDVRHVYRLHGKALDAFAQKYRDEIKAII